MFDNLKSTATTVTIFVGLISVVIALLGIDREWVWSKREKAETLLHTLIEEFGMHILEIKKQYGWNMVHGRSDYLEVSKSRSRKRSNFSIAKFDGCCRN